MQPHNLHLVWDRLAGLVVRCVPQEWEVQGLLLAFPGRGVLCDINIGPLEVTLPRACHRISARTGWPGVSIIHLCETASLIYNFYFRVAAGQIL